MTYPPQPPGPQGPYGQPGQPGQQPGGFPPSGPQPQQPQPGGYPADPTQQYGQPYPTQQFGQPDPYGQQQPGYDPYGQQPGGYPGGPGGPPPKKKTGLIAGLAIAGVLVIGGAAALIIWLTGKDDEGADNQNQAQPNQTTEQAPTTDGTGSQQIPAPNPDDGDGDASTAPSGTGSPGGDSDSGSGGSAEDVAQVRTLGEQAAEAINNKDGNLARQITCKPENVNDDAFNANLTARVVGDPTIDGDSAEIPFEITIQDQTERNTLKAAKTSGRWCISG
ncbi:hypothetical protein [Amycolatopsis cihanbeyliensis]|uniref:DUF4878 domain-containing protein n=1 Tax=Amycolatopsis cihanbeyliensis TaxID=1128664 RepID=A0A542DCE7_AMYCI|nr:hypothetical protein [Amycolatopsis cihanbeyliensis]TQJ00744.1 hypothetical protein FB471_0393 [Amycolatopsis cihanbeyliensis]